MGDCECALLPGLRTPSARKTVDRGAVVGKHRFGRDEHRQTLLDGEEHVAALADEILPIANQGALALGVDGAAEGVQEGLFHRETLRIRRQIELSIHFLVYRNNYRQIAVSRKYGIMTTTILASRVGCEQSRPMRWQVRCKRGLQPVRPIASRCRERCPLSADDIRIEHLPIGHQQRGDIDPILRMERDEFREDYSLRSRDSNGHIGERSRLSRVLDGREEQGVRIKLVG